MSRWQFAALGLLLCGWETAGLAEDPAVYSGPQVGEKIAPYKVLGVYDQYKGKELDFVSLAGDKPFLLVFVHNSTRPAADLTRVLLHWAEIRAKDGLFSSLTFLSDDVSAAERHMQTANEFWHNGPPAGISLDGAEGPGTWGLNRNMMMTVLVGVEGRVTANFPLVQPSDTDAARILPSVTKLVGGTVPTKQEIEFLHFPTRLSPLPRQWEDGKGPTDTKLRALLCEYLRAAEDPAESKRAADEITTHVAGKPKLEQELGEAARMINTRKYGARPPILRLIPKLEEQLQTWDTKYFAPEILAGK